MVNNVLWNTNRKPHAGSKAVTRGWVFEHPRNFVEKIWLTKTVTKFSKLTTRLDSGYRFWPRLHPGRHWGSFQRSPDSYLVGRALTTPSPRTLNTPKIYASYGLGWKSNPLVSLVIWALEVTKTAANQVCYAAVKLPSVGAYCFVTRYLVCQGGLPAKDSHSSKY